MNRQMVIGPMLVVAMATGVYCESAQASPGRRGEHDNSCDCRGPEGRARGGLLARMTRELDLSTEQQAKVRKILACERESAGPLLKKLAAARRNLHEARDADKLDEGAVRTAAAKESELRTELLITRLRTRNSINALLTDDQRDLARELMPRRGVHRGPERGWRDDFRFFGDPPADDGMEDE